MIEAAGTEQAWQDATELARPGGTVVFFGGLPQRHRGCARLLPAPLRGADAARRVPPHARDGARALAFLASGARPWERLITHRVGLEGVAALLADPPRDYLKAAVVP